MRNSRVARALWIEGALRVEGAEGGVARALSWRGAPSLQGTRREEVSSSRRKLPQPTTCHIACFTHGAG